MNFARLNHHGPYGKLDARLMDKGLGYYSSSLSLNYFYTQSGPTDGVTSPLDSVWLSTTTCIRGLSGHAELFATRFAVEFLSRMMHPTTADPSNMD